MTVKKEHQLQDGGAPEYVYHDRTAWRCAVCVGQRYGSKGYPRRNAAHVWWTLPVTSSSPLLSAEVLGRADRYQRRTLSQSASGDRHAGNVASCRRHHLSRQEGHHRCCSHWYWLFTWPGLQHLLRERFPDDEAVQRAVCAWFRQQPQVFYATGVQGLVKQWDKCLNLYGDYAEN